MSSGPSSIITLTTRHRPWWAWWLIAWARWLHGLTGSLATHMEQ
ncbi:MAG: hypothetical protein AB1601_05275 [Planctomycetota bacterium]